MYSRNSVHGSDTSGDGVVPTSFHVKRGLMRDLVPLWKNTVDLTAAINGVDHARGTISKRPADPEHGLRNHACRDPRRRWLQVGRLCLAREGDRVKRQAALFKQRSTNDTTT